MKTYPLRTSTSAVINAMSTTAPHQPTTKMCRKTIVIKGPFRKYLKKFQVTVKILLFFKNKVSLNFSSI